MVALLASGILMGQVIEKNSALRAANETLEALQGTQDDLKATHARQYEAWLIEKETLSKRVEALEGQVSDLKVLQETQVTLEETVLNWVNQHPEMFPSQGVLGGTMKAYTAKVIDPYTVYVAIEDGHISGFMLINAENLVVDTYSVRHALIF